MRADTRTRAGTRTRRTLPYRRRFGRGGRAVRPANVDRCRLTDRLTADRLTCSPARFPRNFMNTNGRRNIDGQRRPCASQVLCADTVK